MTGNKSQAPNDEAQIHALIDRCASPVPFSGFGCLHGNLGDVFGVV
jgi:hypothetical protein